MKKLLLLPLFLVSCTPLVYTPADTVSNSVLELHLKNLNNNFKTIQEALNSLNGRIQALEKVGSKPEK